MTSSENMSITFQDLFFFPRKHVALFESDEFIGGRSLAGLTKKNIGEDVVDLYAPQRMQAISFLTDYFAINAIWMIESCRRGNVFTFARM